MPVPALSCPLTLPSVKASGVPHGGWGWEAEVEQSLTAPDLTLLYFKVEREWLGVLMF